MDRFPSHLLYVRIWIGGKNKYVRRQSLVCLPIFAGETEPTLQSVTLKFGPCFSAYLLQLQPIFSKAVINNATLEVLLNTVHFTVAQLYSDDVDTAYEASLANKTNHVYAKPFLEQFHHIEVGGKIQATVDDLLHSFVERDEPLFSTSLSLRFITNESNQTLEMFASNGQYYLQLFSHGYFSADTVAGFRIRGPLCLATDKVLSVDCRMVSTDADVYQCFGETLQHFLHSPQQFGSTFPWLRSFLLRTLEVYYSQCSCDNMSIAEPSRLASAAKFAHGKPKEENARLQAIAQELSSGKSHISEIMQMSLSRLDFIPSSNTEYAMRQIHHYTRNSMDQTSRKIVSSRQTQEPRGECSNEDQYNDYENPILAKALFSLAENNILQANSVCGGGCDEQLLSSKTRNQNRLAHLLAESSKLEGRRRDPMASFRKRDLEFQQTDTIGFVEHRTKDGQQSHFHSFCGDSLPTTDLQVSKLFHAHQPPKRRKIEISGENNKLIDLYNCREESILESEHKQLPSMELLQLIKEVAASKLGRQNTAGTAIHSLEKRFSSSALVALGVVIEEITKETIHSWYSRGVPLPYNAKNVLKETLAQLGGSPLSHSFTDEIVMNRLNALFAGRAKANKQQVLQLSAFLKRGGAQLPKCDETFGKLSSFHEGSTLNESNASSKVLDTFSVNSVPNFLPMYSRLPPNVRDEEKGHEKYPAYLQESFHAGTQ